MLGTLGLTVELWSPGAVLPGVAGGICLLLAFFAFQVLPVSAAGILLILFGMVLLILEVKVTSYGVLATGGLISLLLGSMMLIDSPLPELRVGLRLIVPLSVAVAGIVFFLVRLAVRPSGPRRSPGPPGSWPRPAWRSAPSARGASGGVQTHGEIWSAVADVPIHAGDTVRIVAVNGLLLTVASAPQPRAEPS